MTTSPVLSITEELLSELELHARQAVCDAITDGFPYDPRIGLTTIEENFCVAANPATILALVEHIRSLIERLQEAEKDVKALSFMLAEECRVRGYLTQYGVRYGLIWDDLGESQVGLFTTQREAIDAAIAQEGQSHE